jgi:hypothetical protein
MMAISPTPITIQTSQQQNTVKPVHVVTSIKQSPLLSSHLYAIVLSVLLRYTDSDYLPLVSSNSSWLSRLFNNILVVAIRIIISIIQSNLYQEVTFGTTYKTKDRVTRTQLKTGVNSGAPEG